MRGFRAFCAVLAAVVIGGCSTHSLREAQESYANAAAAEGASSIGSRLSVLAQYKIALAAVDRVITERRAGLDKDGLLGVAYTLKALTQFKIADLETDAVVSGEGPSSRHPSFTEAKTKRQELLLFLRQVYPETGKPSVAYGTRDGAIMRSLYGLYDYIGGRAEPDHAKSVVWFKSALNQLEEARKVAPETHDVQAVIALYELTVLAEWDWRAEQAGGGVDLGADAQGNDMVEFGTRRALCRTEPFWRGGGRPGLDRENLSVFWQKILIGGVAPTAAACAAMRLRGELN
ncbi:MAG TPA: hypothetical protein VGB25_06690 [Candidatus Binatia bacterium]